MRPWFYAEHDKDCGNFSDDTEQLLALFTDPDARGSRRWREVFGLEPGVRDPVLEQWVSEVIIPLIGCEAPVLSSGSKLFRRR